MAGRDFRADAHRGLAALDKGLEFWINDPDLREEFREAVSQFQNAVHRGSSPMMDNPELIRVANCGTIALASDVVYGLVGFEDEASRVDYLSHALYFAYMAGMNSR